MNITMEEKNECLYVSLDGKLDTLTSPELQPKLVSEIDRGFHKIILDFTKVDYISSAGLRVLLIAQKKVTPHGGSVVLLGINETLIELFEVSGFSHFFCFTETLDESLKYLKG
jgi:anti-anti-sigma factor